MLERTKKFVRKRAENRCEYCLSPFDFSPAPFSIEHIIPTTKDGSEDDDNLAFACQGCNGRKYNHTEAKDPFSGKYFPLYHPRKDNWSEHFAWNDATSHLIALSPTGRATIERLKLNRREVVNLRKLLILIGEHPPH
ncbi:MAG TPA: HNH endonuclease signature motif containing protein [Saprospiraceae bacterium]|nr:HNH endonuclease signature motif containing protein [Saprospiraceae bacterium]